MLLHPDAMERSRFAALPNLSADASVAFVVESIPCTIMALVLHFRVDISLLVHE
jgi:hypothetical protein